MRIVVLQLARLGDILQTFPALQAIKKANPQTHITFVARNTFADAARLSPHIDKLIEFPSQEILGPYISIPNPTTKQEALEKLKIWLGEFAFLEYDHLINLTFSEASSYLAHLIWSYKKTGSIRAQDGAYFIRDPWSQYFYAQVMSKNINMLHLNDLFMRISGEVLGGWPVEILNPPVISIPLKKCGLRIGIQLSASQAAKTPHLETWSLLCNALVQDPENLHDANSTRYNELVFFGSASDLSRIEKVISSVRPEKQSNCTVLAGTLRFHENVPWVKACDYIITPDTAMVHLASICNTKIIYLAYGNVRPEETGPYGDDHHILNIKNVNIQDLLIAVSQILNKEEVTTAVAHATTRLISCSNGSVRNEVTAKNFQIDEAYNFFLKSYYLLAEFRNSGFVEDLEIPKIGGPDQPETLTKLNLIVEALSTIRRLSEFGRFYCLKMLENLKNKSELQSSLEKLNEIEALLKELQSSVFYLRPLIELWRVAKDNIQSTHLEELVTLSEGTYRELSQNVAIIEQLLEVALNATQVSNTRRVKLCDKMLQAVK